MHFFNAPNSTGNLVSMVFTLQKGEEGEYFVFFRRMIEIKILVSTKKTYTSLTHAVERLPWSLHTLASFPENFLQSMKFLCTVEHSRPVILPEDWRAIESIELKSAITKTREKNCVKMVWKNVASNCQASESSHATVFWPKYHIRRIGKVFPFSQRNLLLRQVPTSKSLVLTLWRRLPYQNAIFRSY
jgi:hypothetical protein